MSFSKQGAKKVGYDCIVLVNGSREKKLGKSVVGGVSGVSVSVINVSGVGVISGSGVCVSGVSVISVNGVSIVIVSSVSGNSISRIRY